MPKLSIITINYNNLRGLQKTIESVVSQTFKDFEYIIIDGGSTDGSKALIEKYAESITYWVSEKDNGIYPAMNKGIQVANGEYLLFLNSGDWLCKGDVIEELIKEVNGIDIIYGDWCHVYSDGRIIEDKFPDLITFNFLAFEYSLPHQASLIKKSLFARIGLYDEQLKMVSDWKFYLQAIFTEQCSYMHKHLFIVYYNKEGFSSNPENDLLQQKERKFVLENHFKNLLYLKENKQKISSELQYYKNNFLVRVLRKFRLLKRFNFF